MSRRFLKVCVAGALVASALVGASSASANWTTNGSAAGTTVTFTTSQSSTLTVTATGAAGTQGITCAGGINSHADFFGPSLASGNAIATITALNFIGPCNVVGQTAAVKCTNTASSMPVLNAVSYASGTSTTTGTITGVHCIIVRPGVCGNATTFNSTGSATGEGITVSGSVGGTYGNTTQQLTILAAGQSL
ncbi:MAG: hypothetical protein JWR63_885, partial [Conexibacter sp.]|nr:hypothetical protein [Conexibacter sp.]